MESTQKTFVISKVINASREKVWEAISTPELMAKWIGPVGFTVPKMNMDFRVGGKVHFCMHGKPGPDMPEADFWSMGEYLEIIPMEKISATDCFADENGEIVDPATYGMPAAFPKMNKVTYLLEDAEEGKIKLSIINHPETDEALEAMKGSGMENGWSQSLNNLAALVE